MEPQKQVVIFLAEFDYQVEQIESIYKSLKNKISAFEKQPVALETVESAGYWIHNLYCAFEDLFKLVAGFWDNELSPDGEFHVHLLKRMLLNIEDVRPPLLSEASSKLLNELRGFRHVFRHAYSHGLDHERVSVLLRKILNQKDTVIKDLKIFRKTIAGFIAEKP
jgi:uncharacterized protein YutE (UPF0331/DUF86 family)